MLSFPFLFLNYNKGVLYVLQFKIIISAGMFASPQFPHFMQQTGGIY